MAQIDESIDSGEDVPTVMARDLKPEDIDEVEHFHEIEAVRVLAHIVHPVDLTAYERFLSPSDHLPPEERRSDWLKRVHRGAINGTSA